MIVFLKTCLVLLVSTFAIVANADCVCRCMNGQNVPLCDNAIDLRPICPPMVCPITPPSVTPIQAPVLPPIGTQSCSQQQVLNPRTGQYEWRTICR
jgi:hypothetical protein